MVTVIDLKGGLEFAAFERFGARVAADVDEAVEVLRELNSELGKRMDLLRAFNVESVARLPEYVGLDRHVLIVDEVADLSEIKGMTEHNKTVAEGRFYLTRLGRLARSVGMHCIVATQRPTVDVLDAQLRDNLPARVAFHIKSDQGSIAILGDGQATELPTSVRGRALWDWGTERMEIQVPWMSREEALAVLDGGGASQWRAGVR